MADEQVNEVFGKSFITALLLAGSAKGAEAAMLDSIQALNIDEDPAKGLLQGTVIAALGAQVDFPPRGEVEQAHSMLPMELRRVLRLPLTRRRCYVLRVLLGWPPELCARLLKMEGDRVNDEACFAAQALARMVQEQAA